MKISLSHGLMIVITTGCLVVPTFSQGMSQSQSQSGPGVAVLPVVSVRSKALDALSMAAGGGAAAPIVGGPGMVGPPGMAGPGLGMGPNGVFTQALDGSINPMAGGARTGGIINGLMAGGSAPGSDTGVLEAVLGGRQESYGPGGGKRSEGLISSMVSAGAQAVLLG